MSLTTTEIATRFGAARPGFELVSAEEVGLPYFRLALELVVLQRTALPTVDEFVLRAVLAGSNTLDDVAGVLGLERVLVEQAVVTQCHLDHLDYQLVEPAHERLLRVTALGETALREATMIPERTEIEVGFDRLLWAPTGRRFTQLIRMRQARDFGLLEIPPRAKKRLSIGDLETDGVERAIHELPVRALRETDVLALTNVTNHRYVLPAVALVYVSEDSSATQVAFAIDGRLSDPHERAFAELDGPQRCDFVVDRGGRAQEAPALPPGLQDRALSREQVLALQARETQLAGDFEDAGTKTETLSGHLSIGVAADKPVEGQAAQQMRRELDMAPARAIETYEHRVLLEGAIVGASKRLLIMAPHIRSAVVGTTFLAQLERLCRNHVPIHIGWGSAAGEELEGPVSDSEAMSRLRSLASKYRNLHFVHVGEGQARVLIWDDSLVISSFPWLSFSGGPQRQYRQESGVLIRDPAYVEDQYQVFRRQFEDAERAESAS